MHICIIICKENCQQIISRVARRADSIFQGEPQISDDDEPLEPARKSVSELEQRVATLEENYAQLKADLDHLMKELMG